MLSSKLSTHQDAKYKFLKALVEYCKDDLSAHPTSKLLGIPKLSILLARLIVDIDGNHLNDGKIFSQSETNDFARIQIICNDIREDIKMKKLSLLHLTPRLLCCHDSDWQQCIDIFKNTTMPILHNENAISEESLIELFSDQATISVKKRVKKSKTTKSSSKSKYVEMNTTNKPFSSNVNETIDDIVHSFQLETETNRLQVGLR